MSSFEQIEYRPILDYITNAIDQHFNLKEAAGPIKMLEIGCGPGALTTIIKRHYKEKIDITAIDPSAEAIENAKKDTTEDINFQNAGIFNFDTDVKYDLIFFSKSLHHCVPVDKAVQNAHNLMADNGILISEEVFPDDVNDASVSWFFDRLDMVTKCGIITRPEHTKRMHYDWETRLLNTSLSHKDRWVNFGHSECATSALVKKALYSEFGESKVKHDRNQPFYFHFLILAGLNDNEAGHAALGEMIAQEKRAIKEGTIIPLGGNYVVHK